MTPVFYDFGELARIQTVFANSAGTAVDPTVVKFKYYAKAIGVATTYTYGTNAQLVRGGTGVYYVDIDTNESAGLFYWDFLSTGTGQAADQGQFYVRPAYASTGG